MVMTIKEFLFYENKTITQAAKDLMISRVHMQSISQNKSKPSDRLARDIENYTNGQVKAIDLLNMRG